MFIGFILLGSHEQRNLAALDVLNRFMLRVSGLPGRHPGNPSIVPDRRGEEKSGPPDWPAVDEPVSDTRVAVNSVSQWSSPWSDDGHSKC